MSAESNSFPLCGGIVHTLVQSGTTNSQSSSLAPIIVNGKGADFKCEKTIKARIKKKIVTQKLILSLIDVAIKKKDKESVKKYWNTYYCLDKPVTDAKRLYGKYCKNRICTVCSGNRKAELINKYLPIINQWEEPHFVTLTIKSVSKNKLPLMMRNILVGLNRIIAKNKKRSQRGKGKKLMGIRSLECNFNPINKTYNPHFHLIVPDKETADILVDEWLVYSNKKGFWASKKAQDKQKIYDNEKCLVEVIKYGSKIITVPKENESHLEQIPAVIYANALHNILVSMNGLRLFERFGFNANFKPKTTHEIVLRNYEILKYNPSIGDWEDDNNNSTCNFKLPDNWNHLLEFNIDLELE